VIIKKEGINMLSKIYRHLHRSFSRSGEKGEYSGGYWQDRVRRLALGLCRGAKGRVLEVGCGEGLFLARLAEENQSLEIHGVDNDAGRLGKARTALRDADLSVQDASTLSFPDGYFDIAVCINVLFNMESIETAKRILREMKRVLRSGGRLIFDFRNSGNPLLFVKYRLARYYDDTLKGLPLNTYSPKEIAAILYELRFKVVKREYIGFPHEAFASIIVIEAKKDAL